jgi:sporulation protein YlmC with PRC-barrel domain
MNKLLLLSSVMAAYAGLAAPSFSAEPAAPAAKHDQSVTITSAATAPPAAQCVSDLSLFNKRMHAAANWMGVSDYGYGYPLDGYGYGYDYPMLGFKGKSSANDFSARPGYEIRNLLITANILARRGEQQACEAVLATTRTIYGRYAIEFRGPMPSGSRWRQQQIASASPVAAAGGVVRSDQLIDTDVRNATGEALGTIHDLVIDPKTGKIAYLIIAQGGLFGIDQRFVPVPWNDFKVTASADMLILDTTRAIVAAAPTATDTEFRTAGQFAEQSRKADAYWTAKL